MSESSADAPVTNITGYLNPNTYPVLVSHSESGVYKTVPPKSYLVNAAGRKINDPRLMLYCSPGQLSEERSATPVPITYASDLQRVPSKQGFSGQADIPAEHKIKVYERPPSPPKSLVTRTPEPIKAGHPVVAGPVISMSMSVAKNLGLVPAPQHKIVEGIDDPGQASTPQNIPTMTDAPFVRPTPRGLAALKELAQVARETEAANVAMETENSVQDQSSTHVENVQEMQKKTQASVKRQKSRVKKSGINAPPVPVIPVAAVTTQPNSQAVHPGTDAVLNGLPDPTLPGDPVKTPARRAPLRVGG